MAHNASRRQSEVVDLRKADEFIIEQYIQLRNSYTAVLLTFPVGLDETKQWLKKDGIEARVLVKDNRLLGAGILYIEKDGEVTFFVREPNKGLGTELLKVLEEIAEQRGLTFIWAWVLEDNKIAQRVLEKNGFMNTGICQWTHQGENKRGYRYEKFLKHKDLQ